MSVKSRYRANSLLLVATPVPREVPQPSTSSSARENELRTHVKSELPSERDDRTPIRSSMNTFSSKEQRRSGVKEEKDEDNETPSQRRKKRGKHHERNKHRLDLDLKETHIRLTKLQVPPNVSRAIVSSDEEGITWMCTTDDEEDNSSSDKSSSRESDDLDDMDMSNFSQEDEVIIIESESSFIKAKVKKELDQEDVDRVPNYSSFEEDNDERSDNEDEEDEVVFLYSKEAFSQLTERVIKQEVNEDGVHQEDVEEVIGHEAVHHQEQTPYSPKVSSSSEGEEEEFDRPEYEQAKEPIPSTSKDFPTTTKNPSLLGQKSTTSAQTSSKRMPSSPEQLHSVSTPPKRIKHYPVQAAPQKTAQLIAPMPHLPRSRKKKVNFASSPPEEQSSDPCSKQNEDHQLSLMEQRRAKLRALAEKRKSAKEPIQKKVPSAAKVAQGGARSRMEKMGLHLEDTQDSHTATKSKSSTIKNGTESINGPSPIRMEAEKRHDGSGHLIMSKLTFKNSISNVGSQNIWTRPLNPKVSNSKLHYNSVNVNQNVSSTGKDEKANSKISEANEKPLGPNPVSSSVSYKRNASGIVKASKKVTVVERQWDLRRDFLHRILHWNVGWIAEQQQCKTEPPILSEDMRATRMRTLYSSFGLYCSAIYPLLLHETWASISDQWTRMERHTPTLFVTLTQFPRSRSPHSLVQLSILGMLNQHQALTANSSESRVPCADLWVVKLAFFLCEREVKEKFGILRNPKLWELRHARLSDQQKKCVSDLKRVCSGEQVERSHFFEAVVEVRLSPEDLHRILSMGGHRVVFTMSAILRLKNLVKTFCVINEGPKTPIFPLLMEPSEELIAVTDYHVDIQGELADLELMSNLNVDQSRVVRTLASRCTTPTTKQFVGLVKGPPGTGKTLVIVALILQMFFQWRKRVPQPAIKPKLLLVAPSNAAVDAVIRKLMPIIAEIRRSGLSKLHLNVLRVGNQPAIHPDVKPHTLDVRLEIETRKVEAEYLSESSLNDELRVIQEEINGYGSELEKLSNDDDYRRLLNRKIKERSAEMRRIRIEMANAAIPEVKRRHIKNNVTAFLFNQADIIATTLASSRGSMMEQYLLKSKESNKKAFEVCIIDEASQCSEPECLLPLGYNFTKMVMVGDPEQLPPTVLSQKAKTCNYGLSLFSRLLKIFDHHKSRSSKENISNPKQLTQMLRTQYRMHPDISSWPNRHFYGGKLINGHTTLENSVTGSKFTIRPYALFDLLFSEETQRENRISNSPEAKFVATFLDKLLEVLKPREHTVSVLTFYSQQVRELKAAIGNLGIRNRCKKLDVSTVDSFQGSEADIVFISCVRSTGRMGFTSNLERLNVALTRAKRVCYVVGNLGSFKNNEMWRQLVEDAERRKVLFHVESMETSVLPLIQLVKQ